MNDPYFLAGALGFGIIACHPTQNALINEGSFKGHGDHFMKTQQLKKSG
jgi:hypothetical protein